MVVWIFVIGILLASLPAHLSQNPAWKCPFAASLHNAPALPTLPDSYQLKVEANIQRGGDLPRTYTEIVDEVYDYYGNRAYLVIRKDGVNYKAIYNFETDELYYIFDANCQVEKISENRDDTGFFGFNVADGREHIFSANDALRFGKQFNETYLGVDTVRGIQVNHWQTCMYWRANDANFTVDWYFSTDNWTTSEGISYSQVPVRAVVQGQGTDGGFHLFNHSYEFFYVKNDLPDDLSQFETPEGIVCPGRKQTRKLPVLPVAFSYNEEVVHPLQQAVQNAKVWYDSTLNLVRYDYRDPVPVPPFYSTDPYSAIQDFTSGVAYVRDNLRLNCSITTLSNATFTSINANKSGYAIRMRSPDELFYLDSTYSYEGQRRLRNLDTDVFITRKPFQPPNFDFSFDANIEAYFLADNWFEVAPGINVYERNIPTRLTIWATEVMPAFEVIYNIFNFDDSNPDARLFDVSDCYPQELKQQFQIQFPGPYFDYIDQNQREFEMKFLTTVGNLLGIRTTRLQYPRITYDLGAVYVDSTLLDKIPASALFTLASDSTYHSNDKTYNSILTADGCATLCENEGEFSCNGFDYCGKTSICYLSKLHAGTPATGGIDYTECAHYSRNIDYKDQPEPSLDEAWLFLKNSVYTGLLSIDVIGKDGSIYAYIAGHIRDDIIKHIDTKLAAVYLTEFQPFKQQVILLQNDKKLTGLSVDECAKACTTEMDFECQSFDYCYNVGECLLSKVHPSDNSELIWDHDFCDLFSRMYQLKFDLYPGTSLLTQQDFSVTDSIASAEDCAKACIKYTGFECRSFDYCAATQVCLLGKKHALDIPASGVQANPMCNHYSRRFIDDFRVSTRNTTIPTLNQMVVRGTYPHDCAKLCAQDMGDGCEGFGFCSVSNVCILDSQKLRDAKPGQADIKSTYTSCDYYKRINYHYVMPQDNFTPRIVTVPVTVAAPPQQYTHTDSDMIALGFGIAIAGILFGALIVFAFYQLRKPKQAELFQMENINYDCGASSS